MFKTPRGERHGKGLYRAKSEPNISVLPDEIKRAPSKQAFTSAPQVVVNIGTVSGHATISIGASPPRTTTFAPDTKREHSQARVGNVNIHSEPPARASKCCWPFSKCC